MGLEIISLPSIPQGSLSFFVSLKFFVVNVKLFMLKSYFEAYEMESVVTNLVSRSSAPRYISLE